MALSLLSAQGNECLTSGASGPSAAAPGVRAKLDSIKMKKLLAIMGLLSLAGVAKAENYAAGQVWSYKTRPSEKSSTVLINRVDSHEKLGRIFHISVFGVEVKNPHVDGGVSTELPHFPVSEETLKKSLIKLINKRTPNSEYVEGYNTWKEAFDAGQAGIFTISVSEIVGVVEQSINAQ